MQNELNKILRDSFFYSKSEFTTKYRDSVIGGLWIVLNPILMLGLYVLVFGYIFGGSFSPSGTKMEYGIGIYVGLSLYGLIGETLSSAPNLILSKSGLVGKISFPLEIIPLTSLLQSIYRFLISIFISLIFAIFYKLEISPILFILPIIVVPVLLLACGIAFLFSALGVFFRDLQNVTNLLSRGLFFASAIFYPINSIPEDIFNYLKYNPVVLAIDSARNLILWGEIPNYNQLIYLYCFSIVTFIVGLTVYRNLKKAFADVI
ncbi:ABC transporter permease [Candidatus Pelagisphaera phototrophica]|uniref:ABC transporter permease n=1 Tax=Candidatus Pelagisphaera phototrophica TaxID=2684113 RepID=UPI001A0BAFE9|nr:ABC transporter permease [Candidatus Pelagisphaera phototrophica]QXD32525.1 ABC transporter permease [Candidatus Pelagisphaera phototrophica]